MQQWHTIFWITVIRGSCLFITMVPYHSDNHESIIWYMNEYADRPYVKTISTVIQDNVSKLAEENLGRADYIIAVDGNMTETY